MDKAGLKLEITFADFEHLAASLFAFSATSEICCVDSGRTGTPALSRKQNGGDNSRRRCVAVADGKTILGGSATSFNVTSLLYQAAVSPFYHYRFYDVTTGTNATAGWDTATGLGVTLKPALTAYLKSLP